MHINSVQLETGGPEGPQNRCSHVGETTTFPKRYALVQVKQYYLQFGSCWDGPGLAQGVGRFLPERPRAELSRGWRPTDLCSRAGETPTFSKRHTLVYAKRQFRHVDKPCVAGRCTELGKLAHGPRPIQIKLGPPAKRVFSGPSPRPANPCPA